MRLPWGYRLFHKPARDRMERMTIDLSGQLEDRLRRLAEAQGRTLEKVIEEAIRQYLDADAITDLQPGHIAATQEKLAEELTKFPPWSNQQEPGTDET